MGRRVLWLVAVFALVGLLACSSGPDFFPLEEGLRWEYAVFTEGGLMVGSATTRVVGRTTIDGEDYAKVVTSFTGGQSTDPEINFYRKRRNGLFAIRNSHRDAGEFRFFAFPLEVGRTWSTTSQGIDLTNTVDEALETASVADQTYRDVLRISFRGTVDGIRVQGEHYLAPGVGTIRHVERSSAGNLVLHLIEFSGG